ncbi:MAG: PIN domain-containing protein [Actinobacteria bacterium]|nr:PIN domain-containing protein [Actinomycetota bacterium]
MRVVADSHAIVWFTQRSTQLSDHAAGALRDAARSEGITVSVATFVDLWYVTQTTQAVTSPDLARLRAVIERSRRVAVYAIDLAVADAYTAIPRSVLSDPWDRFIVATAQVLSAPLVTRDGAIHDADLVETIW